MMLKPSGALLAPSTFAARASREHPTARAATRNERRWWSASGDQGLDDRLLRDIGLSRADVAALRL